MHTGQWQRRLVAFLVSLSAASSAAVLAAKKPVPDRAAQSQAAERIKSVFADEYKSSDRQVKAKLAGQLMELANSENDDVAKFTLYREAVRFASEAGDAQTALDATDAMSEHFAVTPSAIKLYALSNVSKVTLPNKQAIAAADACTRLVQELVADNQFDQAKKAVGYGLTALRKTRDNQRIAALRELGDSIDEVSRSFRSVAQHAQTLKATPNDPTANLEVGKFECFVKGNWDGGLQHLSKGSDEALKKLAGETLASPSNAKEQFKVANGWWSQAEKLDGVMKDRVLVYAGGFYDQALPGLTGLSKATAEKRLGEIPKVAGGVGPVPRQKTVNLLELIDPDKDFKPRDRWAIANGVLQCTKGFAVPKVVFPYHPPEEYDVTVVFAKPKSSNAVGIILPNSKAKTSFAFLVGGENGRALNLMADGDKYKRTFPQKIIHANVRYKVVFSVRKDSVQASINGTRVVDMKTDFQDLKAGYWHRTGDWEKVGICCDEQTVFYAVQITEVTGEGGVTRFPSSD